MIVGWYIIVQTLLFKIIVCNLEAENATFCAFVTPDKTLHSYRNKNGDQWWGEFIYKFTIYYQMLKNNALFIKLRCVLTVPMLITTIPNVNVDE